MTAAATGTPCKLLNTKSGYLQYEQTALDLHMKRQCTKDGVYPQAFEPKTWDFRDSFEGLPYSTRKLLYTRAYLCVANR